MSDERRRREDPERTEPIRNAANVFRPDDSWDEPEPFEEEGFEREDWKEVVDRSVAMGYEVVDEGRGFEEVSFDEVDYEEEGYEEEGYGDGGCDDPIGYGARAARGINGRGYGFGPMGDGFWEMSERALRWYTDMWAFWSQLMSGGMMPWGPPRAPRPQPRRRPRRPRPRPWRRVATFVGVEAWSPVDVEVDLRMPAGLPVLPYVHGLSPQDGRHPLHLTDIQFHPGSLPEAIHVCIRIPPHQPIGLYTGAVFDRRSERRLGTMSVKIKEAPPGPKPYGPRSGSELEPEPDVDRD